MLSKKQHPNYLRVRRFFAIHRFLCLYGHNMDLAKALGIEGIMKEVLDEGSNHPGTCRCEVCRKWWKLVGADEDGKYGPFTAEEVNRV